MASELITIRRLICICEQRLQSHLTITRGLMCLHLRKDLLLANKPDCGLVCWFLLEYFRPSSVSYHTYHLQCSVRNRSQSALSLKAYSKAVLSSWDPQSRPGISGSFSLHTNTSVVFWIHVSNTWIFVISPVCWADQPASYLHAWQQV